jgi:hypothetical protein
LVFHRGRPLVETAALLLDSLGAAGFQVSVSEERPRTRWPWVCRLAREGREVAVLRSRVDSTALPGSFALELIVWADSLDVPTLASLRRLPAGTVVALPARFLDEARLREVAQSRQLTLALLVKLETSRYPVSRQEPRRILLHHSEAEIARRFETAPEPAPRPQGLVVADGERGAADPGVARRIAEFAAREGLWMLDATDAPGSRLPEEITRQNLPHLENVRTFQGEDPTAALLAASDQAVSTGHTSLMVPLDSVLARRLEQVLPLLARRGVALRPATPFTGRTAPGD